MGRTSTMGMNSKNGEARMSMELHDASSGVEGIGALGGRFSLPVVEEYSLVGLERLGVLGEGSFGSVILLRDEKDDRQYALKGLLKQQIAADALAQSVANERSVMMLLDSDFVVRLHRTFQDANHIYFLLEAVLGGELFDIYTEKDLFGKLDYAKFYIGCVSVALQHLHVNRVVYRDLKLENCLLDDRGYLKITDMGIAKVVIGKTYTVCGTADYFAPETLKQSGHNRAVDWWATGVLLFIMASGQSPFDAPDVTNIYKNIIKGFSKVKFPENFPSDLIDVIKSLCRKRPEERVTMQKGGMDNLMAMPFFADIDWCRLTLRTLDAPWAPGEQDVSVFLNKTLTRDMTIDFALIKEWDGSLPDKPG